MLPDVNENDMCIYFKYIYISEMLKTSMKQYKVLGLLLPVSSKGLYDFRWKCLCNSWDWWFKYFLCDFTDYYKFTVKKLSLKEFIYEQKVEMVTDICLWNQNYNQVCVKLVKLLQEHCDLEEEMCKKCWNVHVM